MKEKFRNTILKKIKSMEAIEEKSFWLIAPLVMTTGIVSIISTEQAYSSILARLAVYLCILIPVIMMGICYFKQNYHISYPILCIGLSGIAVPLTFLANGGFDSGMPIFCTVATAICSFCYERKWRLISFAMAIIGTTTAFLYAKYDYVVPYPVDSGWVENDIIFSYLVGSLCMYFIINMILDEFREQANDREVMSSLIDKEVHREIRQQSSGGKLNQQGTRKKVSVLFADISGFTSTSEKMNPKMAADYLNVFLGVCEECIHANRGIIDKFIGDCVMAYWIDHEENGEGVFESVKSVLDIRERLYEASQELYETYGAEMEFSAGIEYGNVVLGGIGAGSVKDFTIIGDAVNTASRIQGMASRGELLVSNSVAGYLRNRVELDPIGETIYLRGKNNPVRVLSVGALLDGKEAEAGETEKPAEERNGYQFHVLGARGSFPVSGIRFSEFGGETSCYILKKDRYAVIIDCGTGLGNAEDLLRDCERIDVLLTHVHYDHIMGLLNLSVFPKGIPVTMYGHFGSWAGKDTIYNFLDTPYWPVNIEGVTYEDIMIGRSYELSGGVSAAFYRADHPNNGCVIRIMAGDRKICIFADMESNEYLDPEIGRDADLMLYDGMFDRRDKREHRGWGHDTWQDAVDYARAENVRRMVVTHHSPELGDRELRKLENEAQKQLASVVFAKKGDVYFL